MNGLSILPKLIKVWPDFGEQANLSRAQAYEAVNKMPLGVRVKLGNRVRLDADKLSEWLAAGGNLADRAS